ncbi:hypothetical protein SmJEL517_g02172 [Synchytrium microbalum]|uniref:Uncharacterized protein n=1 Tax=Synchytrium microbalum TaxID=1806994 RepID=A0A507CBW0_9FUNG|nr:uncharacterized protein SmJEL517_g02172 [Synchytrium microbalum]TPX35496.1 hypothetical protein SmJEL517_g02172 [Synchytrium microbalum]
MLARDPDEEQREVPHLIQPYKDNDNTSTESSSNDNWQQARKQATQSLINTIKQRNLRVLEEELYAGQGEADSFDADDEEEEEDDDGGFGFDDEEDLDHDLQDIDNSTTKNIDKANATPPLQQKRMQFQFKDAGAVLRAAAAANSQKPAVGGMVSSQVDSMPTSESDVIIDHATEIKVVEAGRAIEKEVQVESRNVDDSLPATKDLDSIDNDTPMVTSGMPDETDRTLKQLEHATEQHEDTTKQLQQTTADKSAGEEDEQTAIKEVLAQAMLEAVTKATAELEAEKNSLPSQSMMDAEDESLETVEAEDKIIPGNRNIMEEILYSAIEPGVNQKVLLVINFVFVCLFMSLIAMAVLSGGNIHCIALIVIAVALFGTLQWFIYEVSQIKKEEAGQGANSEHAKSE